jgi:hypothetical protein
MSLFSQKSSPHVFWKWFQDHEEKFFDLDVENEKKREELFEKLARTLQKIDRDVTFEFGPPQSGVREFVISAGGIKRAFPAVLLLTKAAPPLARWKITAFRPRRDTGYSVQIGNTLVDPAQVEFILLNNGKRAALELFIPGMTDDGAYKQIGYLLLDAALGEFDVETNLDGIDMLPTTAHTEGKRHAYRELPALFDQLIARLDGRSEKPS